MIDRKLFFIIMFLTLNSCVSGDRKERQAQLIGAHGLDSISLGDPKKKVLSVLGDPHSKSVEELGTAKYEIWHYTDQNDLPIGFLSMDSQSNSVGGKAVWISNRRQEVNLSYVEARTFPESSFESFKTCDAHWGSMFKVDRRKGILVGLRRDKVFLIEWADPVLLKSWLQQLSKPCPKKN